MKAEKGFCNTDYSVGCLQSESGEFEERLVPPVCAVKAHNSTANAF